MTKNATNFDFCKWICDRKFKNITDPNGTLTLEGEKFAELLKVNPGKVLSLIREANHNQIMHFVIDTRKSFFPPDFEELCKEVLESLKERFLPSSS
jgi:hypothetical protein